MIKKARKKICNELIELAKRYFDALVNSEFEYIYEELITSDSAYMLSSTAWPLMCYKNNSLDIIVKEKYIPNLEMTMYDTLSLAFQDDVEQCRTGLFHGLAQSTINQQWHRFKTKGLRCFVEGDAAILIAASPTIPVFIPFVKEDGKYLLDFQAYWLFSMEMRASIIIEIATYAQQQGNNDLAVEFLGIASSFCDPYQRIQRLMIRNSFIGQIVTTARKKEIANESKLAVQARNQLQEEATSKHPVNIKVLFFAANPVDQDQLRLDEEIRNIKAKIRSSEYRDSVQLVSQWAVRPTDLLQALNEEEPTIVHFSGHGSDSDEIVFVDNQGEAKFVSKVAIVELMKIMTGNIRGILFNTCFSSGQANAVIKHVDFAIGMTESVDDETAKIFAAQFYSAIGFGKSVQEAFDQARVALMVEGITEEDIPQLFVRDGVNPDDIILVNQV